MKAAKKAAEFAQEVEVEFTLYMKTGATVTGKVAAVGTSSLELENKGIIPWERVAGWSMPLVRRNIGIDLLLKGRA